MTWEERDYMTRFKPFFSPLLMHPCLECFDSGGFPPAEPWKLLLHHSAPRGHRADQLPCRQATVGPACCQHEYCQDPDLMPGAQTCMKAGKAINVVYHYRQGFTPIRCVFIPVRVKCRPCFLQRKIRCAKVLNCELPIVPLSTIYCNDAA